MTPITEKANKDRDTCSRTLKLRSCRLTILASPGWTSTVLVQLSCSERFRAILLMSFVFLHFFCNPN